MSVNTQIATLLNNGMDKLALRLVSASNIRSEVENILADNSVDYTATLIDTFGHTTNLIRLLNVVKRKAGNGPCLQTVLCAA